MSSSMQAPSSPSGRQGSTFSRKPARVRCGQCEECVRHDCGNCQHCVKKKKFGGDGSNREACIHRKCQNLQERTAAAVHKPPPPPQRILPAAPPAAAVPYTVTSTHQHHEPYAIRRVVQKDPSQTRILRVFDSINHASRVTDVQCHLIRKACRGNGIVRTKYKHRYFEYYDERNDNKEMATAAARLPQEEEASSSKTRIRINTRPNTSPPPPPPRPQQQQQQQQQQGMPGSHHKRKHYASPPFLHSERPTKSPRVAYRSSPPPFASPVAGGFAQSPPLQEREGKHKTCLMCHKDIKRVIKSFPNVFQAEKATQIPHSSISRACHEGGSVVHDYFFCFENIYWCRLNSQEVIRRFDTIDQAQRATVIPGKMIEKVCKQGGGVAHGYYFAHYKPKAIPVQDKVPEKPAAAVPKRTNTSDNKQNKDGNDESKPTATAFALHNNDEKVSPSAAAPYNDVSRPGKGCVMCDADTLEVIQIFPSQSQAERDTKFSRTSISRACRKGGDVVHGYYFRHATEQEEEEIGLREDNGAMAKANIGSVASMNDRTKRSPIEAEKEEQNGVAIDVDDVTSTPPRRVDVTKATGCAMCHSDTLEVIRLFPSLAQAERHTKIPRTTISKACRRGGGHVHGYFFRRPTDQEEETMGGTNESAATTKSFSLDEAPTTGETPVTTTFNSPVVASVRKSARRPKSKSSDRGCRQPRACEMSDAKTGEILNVFPSLSHAERELEISRPTIAKACRTGRPTAGGHRFREVLPLSDEEEETMGGMNESAATTKSFSPDEAPTTGETPVTTTSNSPVVECVRQLTSRPKSRACEMSDAKTGEILNVFPSLSHAERELKISRPTIAKACRTGRPMAGGYRFREVCVDDNVSFSDKRQRRASPKTKDCSETLEDGRESRPRSTSSRRRSSSSSFVTVETTTPAWEAGLPSNSVVAPKPLPKHMYCLPFGEKTIGICGGCLGSRDQEAKDEPVLLCDGQGCDREFHLGCTHLSEIPNGDFLCMDCDAYGTTVQLQQYFDSCAQERAQFDTSRLYVERLLKKDRSSRTRIPMSELWRISLIHDKTMKDSHVAGKNNNDNDTKTPTPEKPPPLLRPDFLVGKPLQLYCPVGNEYHEGRIIDWRKATHLAPVSESTNDNDEKNGFHGTSDISSSEFLVRFTAGANGRKQSLHCWIILEEHSIAVGVDLIYAKYDNWGPTGLGWVPAQTWLRTSLELMQACDMLDEDLNQVSYETEYLPHKDNGDCWALTKILGMSDRFILPKVETEAVKFFSKSFADTSGRFPKSPQRTGGTGNRNTSFSRQLEIGKSLAFMESQEQHRIRDWYSVQLNNSRHKQALTIVDEEALEPLVMDSQKGNKDDSRIPRECPLVEKGIDRLWIMDLLKERGIERSLDTAASLSCQLVQCTPALVKSFHEQPKAN